MCWLQERQISNVANSHSVCVLFMCVSTVNLYVYIILIFYIVATELSNLLKRYATRTSTTYTATTRTITSTLPTTTTTTTTTRCLGVRPSHFLPFSFYSLYIYIQRYTLKFEYYAIIRDFLSFFTSYYELPPNCVGFAINNSTVLSRMRSSTTLQFMLRFALSVTSWIGRAK